MAEKGSFVSRFLYKALEIVGAAVATAVSGYFVAHLGGFLPSHPLAPTPPTVAAAPSEQSVAKSAPANVPASPPAAAPQPAQSAAAPTPAEAPDRKAAQTSSEATGSAAQPGAKSSKTKTAATPPPRKPAKPETAAAPDPSRPRETTDAKPRETTDAKPRGAEDKDSVEAQVKAALANVDANRPSADVPPRRDNPGAQPRAGDAAPGTTAAIAPRPPDSQPPSTGSAAPSRSADVGSPAQQPMTQPAASQSPTAQPGPALPAPLQVAPVQPTPTQQPDALTTVEIKSRPIATIDTPAAPEAAPAQEEEKGVISLFKHILPDLRRPASSDDAPRPPAAVGQ